MDAKRILTAILEAQGIQSSVNKVICFGLGSLEREEVGRRKQDWGLYEDYEAGRTSERTMSMMLPAMTQHAVALTIAAILGRRFRSDKQPLPVHVQDPAYTSPDKRFLTKKGFDVIGGWGAVGLTLVDDDSFVFSSCPSFPLKQVVADTSRPAAIIWNRELMAPAEEQWMTVTAKDGTENIIVQVISLSLPISSFHRESFS
jgi:hypothetical protein